MRAESYPPGEAPDRFNIGDFILTHRRGVLPALIRFGQRIRFRGDRRVFAQWSHAAMIVSGDGHLVEALARGVQLTHVKKYHETEYTVVNIGATALDRALAVRFALHTVGARYGFVAILSEFFTCIGSPINIGVDGQYICSGNVSNALCRTVAIFKHDPSFNQPADLAEHFNVRVDAG